MELWGVPEGREPPPVLLVPFPILPNDLGEADATEAADFAKEEERRKGTTQLEIRRKEIPHTGAMTVNTIEGKAKLLQNAAAIPWSQILAFIISILTGLGGICPQPTPPAPPHNTPWNRAIVRRQFRKFHKLSYQDMREWGNDAADEYLVVASQCTSDEWAAALKEAGAS